MQALKDKRVQLSIVGLIVAAAAAYGVVVDEQALLAVVALLAGVAGGVAGRFAGSAEVKEQAALQRKITMWDEMEIGSDHIDRSLAEPVLNTDTIANADRIYDMTEMAEDIGILNQRVTALEALVDRQQADS